MGKEDVEERARPPALSLVTVVFEPELPLLTLQAKSLERFVDLDVFAAIIVIDHTARGLTARKQRSILETYGAWRPRVRILRPDEICQLPPSRGWVGQQVLKLLVHEHIRTPYYLVLDAKNHWQRRTSIESFLSSDGRARGASHQYRDHALRPTLERVLRYLDIEPEPWLDNFPVTHTPVVLDTQEVARMTAVLAERASRPFAEEFVRAELTEFFLYAGWLIATFGGVDRHFDGTVIRSYNVWPAGSAASDFARAIADAREGSGPFLSVHRKALASSKRRAAMILAEYWCELGLFRDGRGALAFIAAFKLRYLWSMLLLKTRTKFARGSRA